MCTSKRYVQSYSHGVPKQYHMMHRLPMCTLRLSTHGHTKRPPLFGCTNCATEVCMLRTCRSAAHNSTGRRDRVRSSCRASSDVVQHTEVASTFSARPSCGTCAARRLATARHLASATSSLYRSFQLLYCVKLLPRFC